MSFQVIWNSLGRIIAEAEGDNVEEIEGESKSAKKLEMLCIGELETKSIIS